MYRSSSLEKFEVGDHASYLYNQAMFGNYAKPIEVKEITEEEAKKLAEGVGEPLNDNKKFVCIEKTEDHIVFVNWHDWTYETRKYSMKVKGE